MNLEQRDSAGEREDLTSLIRTGQLFAVQRWLAEYPPAASDVAVEGDCPLLEAVETGFHSMVEVLVKAVAWPKDCLNEAFDLATKNHRPDIACMLRGAGATMEALDFEEVCRSMNQNFMEEALRNECSAARGNGTGGACRLPKSPSPRRAEKEGCETQTITFVVNDERYPG